MSKAKCPLEEDRVREIPWHSVITGKICARWLGHVPAPICYTLATWTTGAVLTNTRGIPDSLATLAFMAGAVLGFVFIAALAFGDVTKHFDQEQGRSLLWGSFHFF